MHCSISHLSHPGLEVGAKLQVEQLFNQPQPAPQPKGPFPAIILDLGTEVNGNGNRQKRGVSRRDHGLEYVCASSEREMSYPLGGLGRTIMLRTGHQPRLVCTVLKEHVWASATLY